MMVEPLIRIVVYGTPGTAGSKSAFPLWRKTPDGGREFVRTLQVEKDLQKVKANWRTAVMAAAEALIVDPDTERIRPPFPLDEALYVDIIITVKKPAGAPKTRRTWPATKPDRGKYARAIEDALIAAGVIKDDGRIVDGRVAKVFPCEDRDALDVPGAVIRVWRAADMISPSTAETNALRQPAGAAGGLW